MSTPPRGRLRRRALFALDVLLAVLIAGSNFVPLPPDFTRVIPAGPWLVTAALALLARHRLPRVALIVCVGSFVAASQLGTFTPTLAVAVAIAMFALASSSNRRITVIAGAVTALVLPLSSLGTGPAGPADPWFLFSAQAVQLAAVIAFAAAAGDAARSHREAVAAATDRAERAEQTRDSEARRRVAEDRLRIARDLHDVIAHQMAVINLSAGVASGALRDRPDDAEASLATIRAAARAVLGEIDQLLTHLRTSSDPLDATPRQPLPGLDDVERLVARFASSGMHIDLSTTGKHAPVRMTVDTVAYHVLLEALTNAHKHGTGNRASVCIGYKSSALVIQVDNPIAVAGPMLTGGGHGLVGMTERLALVGGTLTSGPDAAGNFHLEVTLPIERSRAKEELLQ